MSRTSVRTHDDTPLAGELQEQGQSVFHNAQELEEFAGVIAKIAEGDGDFFAAGQAQQADGGVANGG
jgi:hypothetical protein